MYDVYHRQEILKAGRIPEDLVIQNAAFLVEMMNVEPPRGIYSHVIGIDIVRHTDVGKSRAGYPSSSLRPASSPPHSSTVSGSLGASPSGVNLGSGVGATVSPSAPIWPAAYWTARTMFW